MARVRLAVGIPQAWTTGGIDRAGMRRFLERAEALGFESAWVVEQVLGSIPSLEPVECLAWAAALTERIRLGTAVLLTPLRSPVHLAKSLATLDQLSGGRLDVGIGLGGNTKVYPAYGITAARRVARFNEGLRLMRALWTEPRVTFAGEFWQLENATMEPKPVQRPHPPLWLGGHHPDALRRAVGWAAGFMGAGSASTATFAQEVELLRGFLAEARRDPRRSTSASASTWRSTGTGSVRDAGSPSTSAPSTGARSWPPRSRCGARPTSAPRDSARWSTPARGS